MIKLENVKSPFMCYCAKVIPLAFDESMSYYECLCNFYNYLKNEIMPTINNNAEATEELQNLFVELKDYVDHYFDNLDVTEEVNAKLDEMVEDGTMEELIAQYLQLSSTLTFNNVAELKEAENLENGMFARTSGYYNYNDGGGAFYKIRNVTVDDNVDDSTIISLTDNSIIAELIVQNQVVNSASYGIKNDGITDVTAILQRAINYCIDNGYTLFLNKGSYLVSDSLTINDTFKMIGEYPPTVWEGNDNTPKIICNLTDKPTIVITKSGEPYDWANYSTDLLPNIYIENLTIQGDTTNKSLCAMFTDTYLSTFKNIFIQDYKNGITASGSYETVFENVITYNVGYGFIARNVNTTTKLINCWFENINGLSSDAEITDTTFLNLYNFMINTRYTCVTAYDSRLQLIKTAIEHNVIGIFNRDGYVYGDSVNSESITYVDFTCSSTGVKSFIDLRNTYIWSPNTLNAYVCRVINTNSKINLEMINKLPDSTTGHANGYSIAENAICRVYSMIDGERVIEATKTNIPASATIIEKSHYTKNGFKIDIMIKDFSTWDGAAISKLTGLPNARSDYRFIGIGTSDNLNFKLSQYGNLTLANNNWINNISNYDMHIEYEFPL